MLVIRNHLHYQSKHAPITYVSDKINNEASCLWLRDELMGAHVCPKLLVVSGSKDIFRYLGISLGMSIALEVKTKKKNDKSTKTHNSATAKTK